MITLIGHGYVGSHIAQELQSQALNFSWITHRDPVPESTSVIINAAGYTGYPNKDACEDQMDQVMAGNVSFPLHLEGNNPFTPIVHITTGAVYGDTKPGGWSELDPPSFGLGAGGVYTGSKVLFQNLMAPYMNKSYLLRIHQPFGDTPHPKNLLTKLQMYPKLVDAHNSLSCVLDVAQVAVFFATTLPAPGIYNVCNPGSTTNQQLANRLGLEKEWITSQEFAGMTRAPRSDCVLDPQKLMSVYPLRTLDQALDFCIQQLKNNSN